MKVGIQNTNNTTIRLAELEHILLYTHICGTRVYSFKCIDSYIAGGYLESELELKGGLGMASPG